MAYVQLSEGGSHISRWFTALACGHGCPEFDNSCSHRIRFKFLHTGGDTAPLATFGVKSVIHNWSVMTGKPYRIWELYPVRFQHESTLTEYRAHMHSPLVVERQRLSNNSIGSKQRRKCRKLHYTQEATDVWQLRHRQPFTTGNEVRSTASRGGPTGPCAQAATGPALDVPCKEGKQFTTHMNLASICSMPKTAL